MSGAEGAAFGIWREANGIPHVWSDSDEGAWAGLGCVHVRDRLFQMDHTRRRAHGRLAEWLGPEALPGDRLARRLGGAGVARANLGNAAQKGELTTRTPRNLNVRTKTSTGKSPLGPTAVWDATEG